METYVGKQRSPVPPQSFVQANLSQFIEKIIPAKWSFGLVFLCRICVSWMQNFVNLAHFLLGIRRGF